MADHKGTESGLEEFVFTVSGEEVVTLERRADWESCNTVWFYKIFDTDAVVVKAYASEDWQKRTFGDVPNTDAVIIGYQTARVSDEVIRQIRWSVATYWQFPF